MIIDFHTHIFPDKIAASTIAKLSDMSHSCAFTDGTLGGLLTSMKKFNVDISVILPVATKAEQVTKINDNAAQINATHTAIISFASMHPNFDDYRAELARIKNLGFKGIKIHPVYQDTNLDDEKFLRIFYRAAELDLIVVTHAGLDIGFPNVVRCTPKMSRHVVEVIGNFKFVLAHMGGWKSWDEVADELNSVDIFVDTAFSTGEIPTKNNFHTAAERQLLDAENFMKLYKIFGADKILFGTDNPWSAPDTSLNFIDSLPIDDADKSKIFGLNAAELLHIKKTGD